MAAVCAAAVAVVQRLRQRAEPRRQGAGDTLTVFSSLPLQGPNAEQARSIVNAQKLALRDAGGKAGDFKVNFASADDATAGGDGVGLGPRQDRRERPQGGREPAHDRLLGDFDSGATAISLPITNEAGFVQVSPASTAVGLTKLVPGAEKGEPDKFYPSGERSFARVVPADDVQASAAARWTRRLGAGTVFVLGDQVARGRRARPSCSAAAARCGVARGRSGPDGPARRRLP